MNQERPPSPDLFFDTLVAYQRTAALKAALKLDLFTAIADGATTAPVAAARCNASPRGVRILCDYLTVLGFLQKSDENYRLTPDSHVFLNRNSPAYAGCAAEFLISGELTGAFDLLAESVKKGGTAKSEKGTVAAEHPVWVTFARTMGGLMTHPAEALAELLQLDPNKPAQVLDISAGHGIWGIAFAKRYPLARVVGLDWGPVLEVALENARAAGIEDRYSTLAGSAFEMDLGSGCDVILVPNFLHHFNATECVRFLKKARAALGPDGRIVIVEFVPNPDRVTPPQSAGFALIMLATTPEGDAYTSGEYSSMLAEAGFQKPLSHSLPASINQAIIARR